MGSFLGSHAYTPSFKQCCLPALICIKYAAILSLHYGPLKAVLGRKYVKPEKYVCAKILLQGFVNLPEPALTDFIANCLCTKESS